MTTKPTSSRLWAAGLALLTFAGITTAVGIRAQESRQQEEAAPAMLPGNTSANGYSLEQLAAYKSQLDAEAERLKKYRSRLVKLAQQIGEGQSLVAAATPSRATKGEFQATPPLGEDAIPPAPPSVPDVAPPPEAPAPVPDGNTYSS